MLASVAAALAAVATVCTIDDPRIDEASGIAPGLRSPGVVWVQNDSGDRARCFAVAARDGHVAATVDVPGARNVDWEDIAVAADAAGAPSVWLADIGDNAGDRDEVIVYRIDEPRIAADARDRPITSSRPDVWRLRYPSGATDAESLAVAPGGTAYVVTKSVLGRSVVYRLPARPDADRTQSLTEVATIDFELTGTPGGPTPLGQVTATGAAFSRDGRLFAVRTYTDAYVWRVDGDLATALRQRPARVALPRQPQGEGIAIAGDRLLVDSEGVGQPVYAVPLPPQAPVTPTSATARTPAPTVSSSVPARAAEPTRDGTRSRYLIGGALALGLAALLTVYRRGRRRRR